MLFEVGKWDSKIDISGPCIQSEYKLESNFRGVVDIYLVECPFVVQCDFGYHDRGSVELPLGWRHCLVTLKGKNDPNHPG